VEVGPKAAGRGAWVCSRECFDAAVGRGLLARALRRPVTGTELESLRAKLSGTNF
jgi:predicted RNA-binding protein YlxR (DUF448 family)